jgi:sugar phosphate isomerase/epimerase
MRLFTGPGLPAARSTSTIAEKAQKSSTKWVKPAKKYGLHLCWHNHNKEFQPMEEGLPFDYLMQNTNAELVSCEMDIYWVRKGGADPLTMMKRYPGRNQNSACKRYGSRRSDGFCMPGRRHYQLCYLFREAQNQGIEHYFVERDNVQDGL